MVVVVAERNLWQIWWTTEKTWTRTHTTHTHTGLWLPGSAQTLSNDCKGKEEQDQQRGLIMGQ